MHRLDTRNLKVTIAAAAMLGAAISVWTSSTASSHAPAEVASASQCSSKACESITWLRMPALRRVR
jgi:hypothetical protein